MKRFCVSYKIFVPEALPADFMIISVQDCLRPFHSSSHS